MLVCVVSWVVPDFGQPTTYLDTTDSELDKSSKHLSAGDLVGGTADGALDQQRVVVGLCISAV